MRVESQQTHVNAMMIGRLVQCNRESFDEESGYVGSRNFLMRRGSFRRINKDLLRTQLLPCVGRSGVMFMRKKLPLSVALLMSTFTTTSTAFPSLTALGSALPADATGQNMCDVKMSECLQFEYSMCSLLLCLLVLMLSIKEDRI